MPKIAIIYTTFLRDNLMYKTTQSIIDYFPQDAILLIGDQGYNSNEKLTHIDYIKSQISCEYYRLPFDCGLSYARNFLIDRASEQHIPFCLITADSIAWITDYDFSLFIQFLESKQSIGIVGFDLENSKCSWEYLLKVEKNGIHFLPTEESITFKTITLKKVDICRNIFLGKTESLKNLWDNELKLAEHEDAFIQYKNRGYEVFWNDDIKFKKITNSTPKEYEQYRKRFADYQKLLKQKLNITNWIVYEK